MTLTCAVFFVASELVSELGVESSETCSPKRITGPVISLGDTSENITDAELSASAFFLQNLHFLDGDLTFVPAGFPRRITEAVCFSCLKSEKYKPILSNCTVRPGTEYPAGTLTIGIVPSRGTFAVGDVIIGFNETNRAVTARDPQSFMGTGDLTRNAHHCAAFAVHGKHEKNGVHLTYFEYANQSHCNSLLETSRRKGIIRKPGDMSAFWTVTEGNARSQMIHCSTNQMGMLSFREAVRMYRAMQMENTLYPIVYHEDKQIFKPLAPDDVYRAVLSMKLIDDGTEVGQFYEYSSCGYYNVRFIVPLFITILMLCLLAFISTMLANRGEKIDVPYNSSSWFKELARIRQEESGGISPTSSRQFSISCKREDEMVLVENSAQNGMHIEWHTNGKRIRGHRVGMYPKPISTKEIATDDSAATPSSISTPASSPLSEDMIKEPSAP